MADGSVILKPLISRITGEAITSFPEQLHELDDAEEPEVNRMMTRLTVNTPSAKSTGFQLEHLATAPEDTCGFW